jgi:hypothetical protein
MLRKGFQAALACLFIAAFSQVDAASADTLPAPPVSGANPVDPAVVPSPPRLQTGWSPPAADIVLLIDGSLSTSPERADVFDDLEWAAASAIALSEPNPDSRVAVSVFGSRDAPREEPTDPVCIADHVGDGAERSGLEECLGKAAPRIGKDGGIDGEGAGEGADFPAALRQALAILDESGGDRDKIVFVLSDGVLGVDYSPSYPGLKDKKDVNRNRYAGMSLRRLLADDFGPRGIQIRPISFGKDDASVPGLDGVTGAQLLRELAAGGGRGRCPTADATLPRVETDATSVDAVAVGLTALAYARCLVPPDRVNPDKQPQGTSELAVPVPLWAETATITVVGARNVVAVGDTGRLGVAYPDGKPVQGNGVETVVNGRSKSALATLRVQRPVPGTWRVRTQTTDRPIGAFVTWSGEPAAALLVSPARPDVHGVDTGRPRGKVDLKVRVFSRENAFRDGGLLGLKVDVRVTGDGLNEISEPLTGRVATKVGDVAEFTGPASIPAEATGAVRFEALIHTGPGRPTVSRVVHTFVLDPDWEKLPPVQVAPPDDEVTVSQGGSAEFKLAGTYGRKNSTTVGIRLLDMTVPGITVRHEQIPISSRRHGISLVVPKDAPPGRVHGVAEVFDPAHPEVVLSMTPVDFEITAGSGMRSVASWLAAATLPVAVVALILYALVKAVLQRRRARPPTTEKIHSVGGLCLWLERGHVFEDYLQARDDEGTELYFDIIDADTPTPRFARAAPARYTGVLKGTSNPNRLEIDWSNGFDTDVLRLDGKSKTTYGNLIVEVTGRRPAAVHPAANGGAP